MKRSSEVKKEKEEEEDRSLPHCYAINSAPQWNVASSDSEKREMGDIQVFRASSLSKLPPSPLSRPIVFSSKSFELPQRLSLSGEIDSLTSISRNTSSLSSDISSFDAQPVFSLEEKDMSLEFMEWLYVLKCYFSPEKIKDFFNSDMKISEEMDPEVKRLFFKIILGNLDAARAEVLNKNIKHRTYIKKNLEGAIRYIERLATRNEKGFAPYQENIEEDVSQFFLKLIVKYPDIFYFLFSNKSMYRAAYLEIDSAKIFPLIFNFKLDRQSANSLLSYVTYFFNDERTILCNSSVSLKALLSIITKIFAHFESLGELSNLLLGTKKGRMVLFNKENKDEVSALIALLEDKKSTSWFFSETISLFRDKQLFLSKTSVAVKFLEVFYERIRFHVSANEKKQMVEVLISLDFPHVHALLCSNERILKIIRNLENHEEIINRVKDWFSFESFVDTPEKQRAFGSNCELIAHSEKKLHDLRQDKLLSLKDVKSIYNIEFAMQLNKEKELWLQKYKENLFLIINIWDVNQCLKDIVEIRRELEGFLLDKLVANDEDAYNPNHYIAENLPAAIRMQLSADILKEYQANLEEMKGLYEQLVTLRRSHQEQLRVKYPVLSGHKRVGELLKFLLEEDIEDGIWNDLMVKIENIFISIANEMRYESELKLCKDPIYIANEAFTDLLALFQDKKECIFMKKKGIQFFSPEKIINEEIVKEIIKGWFKRLTVEPQGFAKELFHLRH